jgi:RecA-family ATPase
MTKPTEEFPTTPTMIDLADVDAPDEVVSLDDQQAPKASHRWQMQFTVDLRAAQLYLSTEAHKTPLDPDVKSNLEAITIHAKKFFKIGIFEKTAIRLMRKRWPNEKLAQQIIVGVHQVYTLALVRKPDLFGSESVVDSSDVESALQEEPSDFDGSRLEHVDDSEQGWIVQDMVPDDDAILNQGDGGAGKTTTMLQLAVAVATGREWLGMPTVDEPQSVLFFSCEERTKKIRMRIKPLLYGAASPYSGEVTWADLTHLRIVGLADRDALMAVKDTAGRIVPTEMFEFFKRKIELHKPKLVIVDSLYDVYGGDENTRAQVRQFVGLIRRFTSRFGCALIVLGHPSLYGMASGSGTSGSTGWRNAFRGMLYTTVTESKKKGGARLHKIEVKKGNYGEPDKAVDLIWSAGIFVPLVVDQEIEKIDAKAAREKFMELLARHIANGGAVSMFDTARTYAPRVFARSSQAADFTDEAFRVAMEELADQGRIAMVEYTRPDRHKSTRLEPVTPDDEPDFG